MRAVAIVVAAAPPLLGGACGGDSADEGTPTPATTAVATGSGQEIVGEWKRETTCAELAQALRDAGMDELVDEFIAGNGFIPGIGADDPERIDIEQPCKGAVPRLHSHFFTEDGEFGSRDWNGEDVDEGHYRVAGDTLVISQDELPEPHASKGKQRRVGRRASPLAGPRLFGRHQEAGPGLLSREGEPRRQALEHQRRLLAVPQPRVA